MRLTRVLCQCGGHPVGLKTVPLCRGHLDKTWRGTLTPKWLALKLDLIERNQMVWAVCLNLLLLQKYSICCGRKFARVMLTSLVAITLTHIVHLCMYMFNGGPLLTFSSTSLPFLESVRETRGTDATGFIRCTWTSSQPVTSVAHHNRMSYLCNNSKFIIQLTPFDFSPWDLFC